jgi:hypothetical protein
MWGKMHTVRKRYKMNKSRISVMKDPEEGDIIGSLSLSPGEEKSIEYTFMDDFRYTIGVMVPVKYLKMESGFSSIFSLNSMFYMHVYNITQGGKEIQGSPGKLGAMCDFYITCGYPLPMSIKIGRHGEPSSELPYDMEVNIVFLAVEPY